MISLTLFPKELWLEKHLHHHQLYHSSPVLNLHLVSHGIYILLSIGSGPLNCVRTGCWHPRPWAEPVLLVTAVYS